MEIFKSNFLQIQYIEKNNLCIAEWTIETENASDSDFKKWNIELANKIVEKKAISLLANTLNYKFAIKPELQEWSVSNFFQKCAKAGLTKIAIIVPLEAIAEISLEQFIEEYDGDSLETQYFTDLGKAEAWLINK